MPKNDSHRQNFDVEGPKYLTNPDWENDDHQGIVAACLVNAVYVLEKDRKARRKGGDRLAPPWWEFFGFELLQRLEDHESPAADALTVGAVFQLKVATRSPSTSAPTIVIAVRGTHSFHDWGVNIDALLGHGHQRHYCRVVRAAAGRIADDHGNGSNFWLCGHSLGATVAKLVGEEMAMEGFFFTTFLFNPPYILDRRMHKLELHLHKITERAAHVAEGIIGGKFGRVLADLFNSETDPPDEDLNSDPLHCFNNLNGWDPRVYVHPKDWLCKWYIKYFEKKMKGSPMKLPKRIGSATLVINSDERGDELLTLKEAHSIRQWWKEGLRVKSKRYVMA